MSYVTRVFLIPSSVYLSVVFGGAYGSGREVVEFISRHGPLGGFISILTIVLIYVFCLFMCFELARKFKTFEYRHFFQLLLGRGWILYEILIIVGLIVTLAICSSSVGAIVHSHFHVPIMTGGLGLLFIIVFLNYFGREVIEKSMMISVSCLLLVLGIASAISIAEHYTDIIDVFTLSTTEVVDAFNGGRVYALTPAGFIPIILYCCRDLQSRKESFVAAVAAALVAVIPGIMLHLSFMANYPEIIDQTLPAYWMIENIGSSLLMYAYLVVVIILIAQTGVGLLHGVLERIDVWMLEIRQRRLTPVGHASVAACAVLLSSILATLGLVELIIKGFTFFAWAFVFVFIIPLLTVGASKIWRET
jgi:uncharacterized membrane protein YkvI